MNSAFFLFIIKRKILQISFICSFEVQNNNPIINITIYEKVNFAEHNALHCDRFFLCTD